MKDGDESSDILSKFKIVEVELKRKLFSSSSYFLSSRHNEERAKPHSTKKRYTFVVRASVVVALHSYKLCLSERERARDKKVPRKV